MTNKTIECRYCETTLEKNELIEQPDGLECPICGCFAFC